MMSVASVFKFCIFAAVLTPFASSAQSLPEPDNYQVRWDSPGSSFMDSMPLGNGDLGANIWTERNGDIVFLVSRGDAWTENGQLVKLARIRVHIDRSPFTASGSFQQALNLREGEVVLHGAAGATARLWVDTDAPVLHLLIDSATPITVEASVEDWRKSPRATIVTEGNTESFTGFREFKLSRNVKANQDTPKPSVTIEPDEFLPPKGDRIVWVHHNGRSIYPGLLQNQHLESLAGTYPDPLLNRNFGAAFFGAGFASADDHTLRTRTPLKQLDLRMVAYGDTSPSVSAWRFALEKKSELEAKQNSAESEARTRVWWSKFWNRSWIDVSGDAAADAVTQGYAMQRWMTATEGRSAYPVKFNGGIFTVGQEPPAGSRYDPRTGQINADYRAWGSEYWFQNERLLFWPMIADGDFDTLAPFFRMYRDNLQKALDRTRIVSGHEGAAFPETMFFFGLLSNYDYGIGNPGPDMVNLYIRNHVNNGLELTAMMLDTYAVDHNEAFARTTLVPLASAITTWFDRHWPKVDGKLHFGPSQALETRQNAVNPLPDVAGLHAVLPRLLALPHDLTDESQRNLWETMLSELPPIPIGRADVSGRSPVTSEDGAPNRKRILWPAASFDKPNNSENPELYAVFPFRNYGVDQPDLDLARDTFAAKRFADSTCWGQQGIQAAYLGLAQQAKAEAVANFTAYGKERFKWFWRVGHDWEPDLDNGGAGQIILQAMLMQTRGKKIILFPAWPKDWNVNFKLHAPGNTIVEGSYQNGKVQSLRTFPAARARDIVSMSPQ